MSNVQTLNPESPADRVRQAVKEALSFYQGQANTNELYASTLADAPYDGLRESGIYADGARVGRDEVVAAVLAALGAP